MFKAERTDATSSSRNDPRRKRSGTGNLISMRYLSKIEPCVRGRVRPPTGTKRAPRVPPPFGGQGYTSGSGLEIARHRRHGYSASAHPLDGPLGERPARPRASENRLAGRSGQVCIGAIQPRFDFIDQTMGSIDSERKSSSHLFRSTSVRPREGCLGRALAPNLFRQPLADDERRRLPWLSNRLSAPPSSRRKPASFERPRSRDPKNRR
jgi:hypothetical protein